MVRRTVPVILLLPCVVISDVLTKCVLQNKEICNIHCRDQIAETKMPSVRLVRPKAVAGLSSHQHSVIWFWAHCRSAVKPCFCDSLRWETLPIEHHVRRAHASANVLVGQVT